jgi:cytochrome P450
MQGDIVIGSLLERLPRMSLAAPAEELRRRPGMPMRGLTHLPVRLG